MAKSNVLPLSKTNQFARNIINTVEIMMRGNIKTTQRTYRWFDVRYLHSSLEIPLWTTLYLLT